MQQIPTEDIVFLLIVLVCLTAKHFLADFPLQSKYMLRKTNQKGWLLPLMAHSATHAGMTFVILWSVINIKQALALAALDFVIHCVVDSAKARLANYNVFDKRFWVALGLDQMLHNLTYIAIAFIAYRFHLTS